MMRVKLNHMLQDKLPSCFIAATAFVFVLLLSAPSAHGREKKVREPVPFKYEVRAGWGGYPVTDFLDSEISAMSPYPSLEDLYADYNGNVYMTGIISTEFAFHFRKWFSLSLGLSANGIYSKRYSADTGLKTGTDRGAIVTFMPQVRFSYLNREYVKLYSSLGVGFSYGTFQGVSQGTTGGQVVFIGVTAGKKVFGFFEIGSGTLYLGCMAGVGYRF